MENPKKSDIDLDTLILSGYSAFIFSNFFSNDEYVYLQRDISSLLNPFPIHAKKESKIFFSSFSKNDSFEFELNNILEFVFLEYSDSISLYGVQKYSI